MATATFTEVITFTTVLCFYCKAIFAISEDADSRLRNSHKDFWCPYCGKCMVYGGKTEAERLREELATAKRNAQIDAENARRARQDAEHYKRSRDAYKGRVTHLKNRAAAGICPCCNERFPDLHEHMKAAHPEFLVEDEITVSDTSTGLNMNKPLTEQLEAETPIAESGLKCNRCGKPYTFAKSLKKHQCTCKGRAK